VDECLLRIAFRAGTVPAQQADVTRKLAIFLAAVIIPGGFIALLGVWLLKTLGQTERGRKVVAMARQRVPAWVGGLRFPSLQQRQAA
jgi:hypothetical protein